MRFAATRTHPCSHYMPLQCDLHPHVAEHQARTDYTRNIPKRSKPQPPHTEGTLHRRLQRLYTEKHAVSCSGSYSSQTQVPCNIHVYRQYNEFCSTMYTFMQPLQCDSHPRVAEHQGRTDDALKRSKPQPPHTGGTLHGRLQPLHTEKHQVSFSGFLPNTSPMQEPCSNYIAFCSSIVKRCIVMWCSHVMYCYVMSCYVMYCCLLYCYVMYCYVMYCYVMYCHVM